jgi:hypothetical protein
VWLACIQLLLKLLVGIALKKNQVNCSNTYYTGVEVLTVRISGYVSNASLAFIGLFFIE